MITAKDNMSSHYANVTAGITSSAIATGGDAANTHSLRDKVVRLAMTAATAITCGSGGMPVASGESMTSDSIFYVVESRPTQAEAKQVSTIPQEVATIRHFLSLNVSNLATVLRVKRPTIYDWQRGDSKPHASNLKRLNGIYSLAEEWKKRSGVPLGDLLSSPLNDGSTLLESLSTEDIDPIGLSLKMQELVTKREKILAQKGPQVRSLSSIADELGFSPMSPEEGQRSIDGETLHVRFQDED
jgi:DNA-binding transcriptional regulator YiaG